MSSMAEASADANRRAEDKNVRGELRPTRLELTPEELTLRTNEISEGLIIKLRKKILDITQEKIDPSTYSIFEYLGFNPKKIWRRYLAIAKYHGFTLSRLIQDIMGVISMNLYMGNLANNKLDRRSDEGRTRLNELVDTYGIKLGSTGTGLSPETITVPRTSAAFPILACRMANALPTTDTIGMPFKSSGLPTYMHLTAFSSFLSVGMASQTREFLKKCILAYSSDQSMIFSLDKKTRKPTIDAMTAYGKQLTYITAAMNSGVPEEWEKAHMLKEFNVMGSYERFLPVVREVNHLMGLTDSIPDKSTYENDINTFLNAMQEEKTRKDTEDRLIIAEEGKQPQGGSDGMGTIGPIMQPTVLGPSLQPALQPQIPQVQQAFSQPETGTSTGPSGGGAIVPTPATTQPPADDDLI